MNGGNGWGEGSPNLTFSQIEQQWIDAGGSVAMAPIMAAIALAESGGNASAINPTDNGGSQSSWGLWQISNGDHSTPSNWSDPLGNAQLAIGKLNSQGLGAWGTYTSGAYQKYLGGGSSSSGSSSGVSGAVDSVTGGAAIAGQAWNANTKQIVVAATVLMLGFMLWRAL